MPTFFNVDCNVDCNVDWVFTLDVKVDGRARHKVVILRGRGTHTACKVCILRGSGA